jgi:hypothetical protein
MSNLEDSKTSNVYSKVLTIQAVGTSSTVVPNFYVGVSKVLGATRTTVGAGVNGGVAIASITGPPHNTPTAGATVVLTSLDTDVSTYTLFWTNETSVNPLVFPC